MTLDAFSLVGWVFLALALVVVAAFVGSLAARLFLRASRAERPER